jgi:transcriptional regulator
MSNSYIDGLVSPSRNKKSIRQTRPRAGLEVGEAHATKQHLEQQKILQAERLRKQNIRARNMSMAQSDDPLVGQAESRRKLEDNRQKYTADWDFTDGELREASEEFDDDLNEGFSDSSARLDTNNSRRRLGNFENIKKNNSFSSVKSIGLFKKKTPKTSKKDYDEFLENSVALGTDELFGERREKDSLETEKNNHKKKGFFRRHLKLTIVLIILVGGGAAAYFYGDRLISKLTGGKSGLVDLVKTVVSEKVTPLKMDGKGRTNIAIFGTSGYDMTGAEGHAVHDGAQLTDSLMIMSVDQNAKNAVTMSLPRDLKIGREACYTGKINEVFACASNNGRNEEAGATAVMKELSTISGMEMHYYVHVNWGSLVQIVNALGGITVTVDDDINDYYYTGIRMKAGVPTVLDGEKALGLARARHGSVGGDFTRGENQQKVLVGIKNKITEKGLDIPAMINLVNVLGDNLRTNVNIEEIKTAAKVFSNFNPANIASAPLTGLSDGDLVKNASFPVGGLDISFVIPSAGAQNYTKIQQYLDSKIADYSDSPATSRILVLNGTNESGIAANEKLELEKAGFRVTGTGNAPTGEYKEKIMIYNLGNKEQTKQKLETYYGTTVKAVNELPAGIDKANYDFVVIVGKVDK